MSRPRRWSLLMYCFDCGAEQDVKYSSVERSSELANAALEAAGWGKDPDGKAIHHQCPKARA